MTLKVLAYTGGISVPSARFRVRQYASMLRKNDVDLTELISASGSFPPEERRKRFGWAVKTLLEQVPRVAQSHRYDLTLLQREMISTYYTLERFTKKPRVLDVDDAIYLNGGGDFAKKIAQSCQHIVCGNEYLANWFSLWNRNISVQPTAVDTARYVPVKKAGSNENIIVGWIGTSSNLIYLNDIEPALCEIVRQYPHARIRIVSDTPPRFGAMDESKIEFIRWNAVSEVAHIQDFDIGLMPLRNTETAKGKCSFKMLQYMACGKPLVASPVGMNAQVLAKGHFGFAARSIDEWVDSLRNLITDATLRSSWGCTGRRVVEDNYSIDVIGPRFAALLKRVA